MYYAIVALLMFIFPLISVVAEGVAQDGTLWLLLLTKWYVFWAVGMRLSLAGLRQMIQPKYTAKEILGIEGDDVLLVVRELGFANVSLGALGLSSLVEPKWVLGAALAGGLFYLLAGVNHALQTHRNRLENVAMVSDLIVGAALLALCACGVLR
jgi:hypothetical protein